MTDFLSGAIWTLLCILVGVLITLLFVAVLGDRPDDPEPGDEPPIDPTPEELEAWLIENWERDADEMEAWLEDHTVTPPFEANLLEHR